MRSRVFLFVVVGVLLAACGDGGVGGSQGPGATSAGSDDLAASTTTSAPVGTPTTTLSETATKNLGLEWSRSGFDEGLMTSVTQLGDGFVGLVYDDVTEEGWPVGGALYLSTDGMVWDQVESPIGDGEMVAWVAGSNWGAVGLAFKGEGPDQIDMILSDDGVDWRRINPAKDIGLASGEVVPEAAGWGPSGLVVIYGTGVESEQPESLLLFSETGEEWVTVDMPEEAGFVHSVLVADSGYVIPEEPAEPGVRGFGGWFSEDGLSWEQVSIDNVILSGSGGSTGWREGFVVIRDVFDPSADTYGPVVWESSDGKSWRETPVDPFEGLASTGYEDSLQGSKLGLVTSAVTEHAHESDEPVDNVDEYLLFSPDGREWIRWNTLEEFGDNLGPYAISEEAIVALIANMDSTNIQVTVWAATPSR